LVQTNVKLLQKKKWVDNIGRFTGTVPIKVMEKGTGFAASEWEAIVSI
jgi:hypothetical protein